MASKLRSLATRARLLLRGLRHARLRPPTAASRLPEEAPCPPPLPV